MSICPQGAPGRPGLTGFPGEKGEPGAQGPVGQVSVIFMYYQISTCPIFVPSAGALRIARNHI